MDRKICPLLADQDSFLQKLPVTISDETQFYPPKDLRVPSNRIKESAPFNGLNQLVKSSKSAVEKRIDIAVLQISDEYTN